MNCQEYQELTIIQKIEFIGKLTHICQTDSSLFKTAQYLIAHAEADGLLEGVIVTPGEFTKKPE
jgi:hypothetical protein